MNKFAEWNIKNIIHVVFLLNKIRESKKSSVIKVYTSVVRDKKQITVIHMFIKLIQIKK